MYRPPQNSNRVKSIKNKFENIENKTESPEKNISRYGARSNINYSPKKGDVLSENVSSKNVLTRQYSDPLKRNIKRTPAFRLDKSSEKNNAFSRTNVNNKSSLFENKVKQFNSALKICDSHNNVDQVHDTTPKTKCSNSSSSSSQSRPVLFKSKSSHDFHYIRSKFTNVDNNCNTQLSKAQVLNSNNGQSGDQKCKLNVQNGTILENVKPDDRLKNVDLSLLYTEPIPRALRGQQDINVRTESFLIHKLEPDIYNTSTLKLSDKVTEVKNDSFNPGSCSNASLTDTLKCALKKPLPVGPAPVKPPRTFMHCVEETMRKSFEKNTSFLHVTKEIDKLNVQPKSNPNKKADPKYMLNKLENALRNNRLRARKQAKADISTTSGEDSDDSLLFRSKSDRRPKLSTSNVPSTSVTDTFGDFICFNGFGCTNPAYEKIKEPTSSFFVQDSKPEPVYAEPFGHREGPKLDNRCVSGCSRSSREISSVRNNRNSLYYMSTAVLCDGEAKEVSESSCLKQETEMGNQQKPSYSLNTQISAENSSLSSFTSDLDTPSPMDDSNASIKTLINSFESKSHNSTNNVQNIYDSVTIDNTTRVDILKDSLRQTLDKSFSSESAIKQRDFNQNENEHKVSDIITKFQTYIKSMPKYCQPNVNKDTLFYCCLVIEKVSDCAHIKFKFPQHADIPPNIENLCFPERDSLSVDCSHSAQMYSLLLTNSKGERTFGYCRRVLPEGSTKCLPLAYCILSKYRAPRFYKKILAELESRHGIQNKHRDDLISQFYNHKFPQPGESIKINLSNIEPKIHKTDNKKALVDSEDLTSFVYVNKTGEYGTINTIRKGERIFISESDMKNSCPTPSYVVDTPEKTELVLTLHPDIRYEDSDLKRLHKLPLDVLQKIFSSLLLERKVILIGSVISELSSCVDSLETILYPFTWHHTFIPILPESLWDIVESPTPVICGVLSKEVVEQHKIENGIVVNLDNNSIMIEEGDENKILSGSMQKIWRKSIALANKAASSIDYVHSMYLADAYLQVFVLCLKDYKTYVANGVFQKDDLVKNAKTKGIRRFLKMFTETYMFHAFMDSVLTDPGGLANFDKKIEMYGSEESTIVLDKLLEWKK